MRASGGEGGDTVGAAAIDGAAGEAKARLAREFGISRETVYQYLRANPGPTTGGSGCHGQ